MIWAVAAAVFVAVVAGVYIGKARELRRLLQDERTLRKHSDTELASLRTRIMLKAQEARKVNP